MTGLRDDPQGEVETATLGKEVAGSELNTIDAVEFEPRLAAHDHNIAAVEPDGLGGIDAFKAADAEEAAVAQGNREDGP